MLLLRRNRLHLNNLSYHLMIVISLGTFHTDQNLGSLQFLTFNHISGDVKHENIWETFIDKFSPKLIPSTKFNAEIVLGPVHTSCGESE